MLELRKSHKFFREMKMVCNCVPNDQTRYALNCIVVTDKDIVSTDGRRLAKLDNFGVDPGRYIIIKNTKSLIQITAAEIEGNYPNYDDIIPDLPREDEKKVFTAFDSSKYETHKLLSLFLFKLATEDKVCIHVDYLKDFIYSDSYYVCDPERPVMFFADCFIGIIMPIAVD